MARPVGPISTRHGAGVPLLQPAPARLTRPGPEGAGPAVCATTLWERMDGSHAEVRAALARILMAMRGLGTSPEDCETVETVLAEVMNNIVEHAYDGVGDGWLTVRIDLRPGCLYCQVEDAGAPMPGLMPPPGQPQDLGVDLEDLPEGGFGWLLIRSLTRNLRYWRVDDRNRLGFWIPLAGRSEQSDG